MKQKPYVIIEAGGTAPEYVDFEGVHLKLTGIEAFCYRGFRILNGEDEARRRMLPWLEQAKSAELAHIEINRAMITANNHRSETNAHTGA